MRSRAAESPPEPGRAIRPQPFTPVPRKTLTGWTPDRQRRFIAALAATGSVKVAAASVQMSAEGAYLLRAAPGSAEFVAAWDTAVRHGIAALRAVAFDRAINGEAQPVFYQGQQVGERRDYNNALLMRLLTHYDRQDSAEASAKSSIDDPRPSTPAVAARLTSKTKAIAAMDSDDHRRNQQWLDYLALNRAISQAILVRQLRAWIAEGGLEAIIAHLDYLERTEANRLTPAMHAEIARTGSLAQPWRDGFAGLERLLVAESIEAAANAGMLPAR